MSVSKINSIIVSYDGTSSDVLVRAVGNDFKINDFVTIGRCDVPALNGTFRIYSKEGEFFSFKLPFLVDQPVGDMAYAASIAELSIQPKIFSELDTGLSYLYGLSDFWTQIFESPEKINLLLETETLHSSEIYSRFLQLTSTISLSEIQTTVKSQLRLVVLNSDNLVDGEVATYTLPVPILKAGFIMNRPFLPTLTLEEGTHFDLSEDGTQVRIFEKLEYLNFPVRKNESGLNEFSLWFSDAEIDEQLISKHYSKLIGVTPETSTEQYKNFVYGLFYLFSMGPNLAQMRKGLNLILGLPLARDYETVLDIRTYLETDQYLVITDLNQYLIPYGIPPTVAVGDFITPSTEIAQWIQIKDWVNDGKWWLNLSLPESILPFKPDLAVDRYAKEGSYADRLMDGFLKTNTFLVNVNVTSFKNIQGFQELFDIIYRARPSHTTPIYIWSVPLEEIIPLEDNLDLLQLWAEWCENLSVPISRMRRNASETNRLFRGCPQFIRTNISNRINDILGGSELINGLPMEFNGGNVTGFINYAYQYEKDDQTEEDKAWLRAVFNKGNVTDRFKMSNVKFNTDETWSGDSGQGINKYPIESQYRIIPLYYTTQHDLNSKCSILGIKSVTNNVWLVEILKPSPTDSATNAVAVNNGRLLDYSGIIKNNFNLLFVKGVNMGKVGNFIPPAAASYQYSSAVSNDVLPFDYLIAIRIYDKTFGVYWVTTNNTVEAKSTIVVEDSEPLQMTIDDSKISRGLGPQGSPYYLLRGAGLSTTNTSASFEGTNDSGINSGNTSTVEVSYEDTLNTIQVMDRTGKMINIRKDLL